MANGRNKDVIIEDRFLTDERTGIQTFFELTVWADPGNEGVISRVDGVAHVFVMPWMRTKYSVQLDPRYDVEYVKREIEAAILCKE